MPTPSCPHCGGTEFAWSEAVRTGRFGRATIRLPDGRSLPLRTRLCQRCGHAELFAAGISASGGPPVGDGLPAAAAPAGSAAGATVPAPAAPAPEPGAPPASPADAWSETNEPASPEKRRTPRRRTNSKKPAGPALIHD